MTLTLVGDATGSASFDGAGNQTLTVAVANDSHTHSTYLPLAGGTLTDRLTVTGTLDDDGGWVDGILIKNTGVAGESAIAWQISTMGTNYWIAGANQSNNWKLAYGTSFGDSLVKFEVESSGAWAKVGGDTLATQAWVQSWGYDQQSISDMLQGYLAVGAKSADSNLLDGIDSSKFFRLDASNNITNADLNMRFYSGPAINTSTGYKSSLSVYGVGGTGTDAFMQFHVSGDYALYFGLDGGINDLVVGGWSKGAVSYRIWHAGNDGSGSGLDADKLDGQHGSYYGTASDLADVEDNLTSHAVAHPAPTTRDARNAPSAGSTSIATLAQHVTFGGGGTMSIVQADGTYYEKLEMLSDSNMTNDLLRLSSRDGSGDYIEKFAIDRNGKVLWNGGNSDNANTAYVHSQTGHDYAPTSHSHSMNPTDLNWDEPMTDNGAIAKFVGGTASGDATERTASEVLSDIGALGATAQADDAKKLEGKDLAWITSQIDPKIPSSDGSIVDIKFDESSRVLQIELANGNKFTNDNWKAV